MIGEAMDDWNRFGLILTGMREGRGFPSARKFYRTCGGAGNFGCTYRHYVNVEKGRCAPGERLLSAICEALSHYEEPGSVRQLLEEYFRQKFPAKLEQLVRSVLFQGDSKQKLDMQSTFVRHARENFLHISARQVVAYCSSPAAYGVYEILSNDLQHWSVESLATKLKLGPEKIRTAVRRLKSDGVIKQDAAGLFWHPVAEKISVSSARGDPRLLEAYNKLPELWRTLQTESGGRIFGYTYVLRCSLNEFQAYSTRFKDTLAGSAILRTCRKGPDTALVGIKITAENFFKF